MPNPFPTCEDFDDRAHQLYDAGDYDQALEVLREGLEVHPGAAVLHVALGYVRIAREEWAWARRSFARALALDPDQEDAWVGLGESLLKFGETDAALACFAHLGELGVEDDLEIGLAVGRALYREGLFAQARRRFTSLALANPEAAEVVAARGYTLHAMGDEAGARRDLRRALRADPALHEARIYLAHLLFDGGEPRAALAELNRVPPAEHWDSLSLWRFLELRRTVDGMPEDAAELLPWRERLAELDTEPDPIDHLLAEVEAAMEGEHPEVALPERVCTVRMLDGAIFTGTWEQIAAELRSIAAFPDETAEAFIERVARTAQEVVGVRLPLDSAEAFVRASARIGLLHIEG